MKIFISWSGETSHKVALILRDWLPTILDGIEPWVSSEDINKGSRWGVELATKLEESSFGIICVDSSNVNSQWLNFEAGALSKSVNNSSIIPFLIDINPTELRGPLSQFQATTFEKEEMRKLIRAIFSVGNAKHLSAEKINIIFNYTWNNLKGNLDKILTEDEKHKRENSKANTPISTTSHDIEEQNHELTETEKQILIHYYEQDILTNVWVSTSVFASNLKMSKAKAFYFLSKLADDGWIKFEPSNDIWALVDNKKVLKYLVENNLV